MRRSLTVFLSLAVAGGLAATAPAVASAQERQDIPQSHPLWASPQAKVADTAPSSTVDFRVYLNLRDQAGAEAAAAAVSDPSREGYRNYLSPQQVRDRYSATDQTVGAVQTWLRGSGFRIGGVPSNRAYVEAVGTADQVQHAFAVKLGKYSVKGQTLRAADKNLSVPAPLANAVPA